MKAEYQKIVDDVLKSTPPYHTASAAVKVAERCEALANKPVRELTDAECLDIWNKTPDNGNMAYVVRNIVSLYIAKQSEPDEIPFDQKKLDGGGWEIKVETDKTTFTFTNDVKVTLVRKT